MHLCIVYPMYSTDTAALVYCVYPTHSTDTDAPVYCVYPTHGTDTAAPVYCVMCILCTVQILLHLCIVYPMYIVQYRYCCTCVLCVSYSQY